MGAVIHVCVPCMAPCVPTPTCATSKAKAFSRTNYKPFMLPSGSFIRLQRVSKKRELGRYESNERDTRERDPHRNKIWKLSEDEEALGSF